MARKKATAPYWMQPLTEASPSTGSRRSSRLREKEVSDAEQASVQAHPTNAQSASILFKIPNEIRDCIFKFALTAYEDTSKLCNIDTQAPECHQRTSHHHRPDYHHLRTDAALLRTCRRVYDETALLPVSSNAHILYYPEIRVLSFPMSTVATSYFKCMTSAQVAAVQHVHIFTHSSRLRSRDPGQYMSYSALAELGFLRRNKGEKNGARGAPLGIGGPYPKKMTFTIRCRDWRVDLAMLNNRHWENVFGGLKELTMELVVGEEHKEMLMPTVDKLKAFRFDIGENKSLVAETVKEDWWIGPVQGNSMGFGKGEGGQTKLYVATIVWKTRSVGPDRPENSTF